MNRLKIEYGTPEYVVKEKDKVVICYLPYTIRDWDLKLLNIINFIAKYEKTIYQSMHDYVKVCVVVRCKGNDVFDVQKGKKIALAKAENKVEGHICNLIKLVSDKFIQMSTVMIKRLEDSSKNIKHNLDYIKKF